MPLGVCADLTHLSLDGTKIFPLEYVQVLDELTDLQVYSRPDQVVHPTVRIHCSYSSRLCGSLMQTTPTSVKRQKCTTINRMAYLGNLTSGLVKNILLSSWRTKILEEKSKRWRLLPAFHVPGYASKTPLSSHEKNVHPI